ncbi:DNA-directed RNA polymerase subunit B'' [Candidatus Micrarchaeota archaeon]|nr:DNA-directed RNA polymerase subunit B'' [Candidatus Micrarchaeota archaeon]
MGFYWEVAEAMLREYPLIKHHIDSYNVFINSKIHKIVEEANETEADGVLKLHKVRVSAPVIIEADGSRRTIYPMEARLRNRTYAAPVFLEMSLLEDGSEVDKDEVYIGDLPVMVRSDLCNLKGMSKEELITKGEDADDAGGYFIINGTERALVSVEDLAPNRLIVSKENRGGKSNVIGRISSIKGGFRAKVSLERTSDGMIYINFPTSPKNLNLFIVLRALGLSSKSEIMGSFSDSAAVQSDVLLNLESAEAKDTSEALDYLGKRIAAGQPEENRKARAESVLDSYLLPHIGVTGEDRMKKAYFLTRMAERCIEVALNKRDEDDKDHYANKRVKVSGVLMEELFRQALGRFLKDIKYQVERAHTRRRKLQLRTLVRPNAFTDGIRFSMSTGTWVGGRQGISQLLERMCYMNTLSHLRRVVSPLSKSQPHFEARDLHPTQYGKLCPVESPEGSASGLQKNLAIGCVISSRGVEGLEKDLAKLGVSLIKK